MKLHNSTLYRALALAPLLAASLTAGAQSAAESGFFADGYLYRYQLNPAFANEQNFVSLPFVGNFNFELGGNIGISDVLYKSGGRTVTFLNPDISASEVMSNINRHNRLNTRINLGILSGGFKAFGGYNTVSINIRSDVSANIPGTLFSFLKEGIENKSYDIESVDAHATAWTEIAFGHSHKIHERVRVGGALKLLVGVADAKVDFERATLNLQNDKWSIEAEGEMAVSLEGATYKTKVDNTSGRRYVNGLDVDDSKLGIGGYGVALDLGMTCKLDDDWSLYASLTDVGFIRWRSNLVASTNGVKRFDSDDYTFNVDKDAPNSFSEEWDQMKEQLSAIYQLSDNGDTGGVVRMLGATMRVGADYSLPAWRKLTFGVLNTTYIRGLYSHTTFRFSANVAPCRIFSAGLNVGIGSYGTTFGWIMNLHPKGFNLYLASDATPLRLAKQGVPLNSNGSFRLGLNVPF
jgi:hypothetical protein